MTNPNFTSGKWTGFYMYASRRGGQHRQDMILTFNSGGILRGSGSDDVGAFQIRGQFDPQTKEASWTKQYVGGHSVDYRGFCDAMQKAIWGIWDIGEGTTGGFKIWLVGQGHLDGEVEKEAQPVTVVLGKLVPVGSVAGSAAKSKPSVMNLESKL